MRNAKPFVASTKRVLSIGFLSVVLLTNRYDTAFVKGTEKEVGCKELYEPYKKCIIVNMSFLIDT